MSTTYKVRAGDTFAVVARRVYGEEAGARRIAKANPGVSEPLPAGVVLVIPPRAVEPRPQPSRPGASNEVALTIGGRRFRFWESVQITRAIDAVDAVNFSAPFEPDAPHFREVFRPFSYQRAEITVGGERLFTGTMVGVNPSVTADRRTVSVSCYSRPGVLMDCTAPASAYPLEFDYMGLKLIAEELAAPFGISVVFEAAPGAEFERTALEPGQRVYDYLAQLARERNLVLSSTPDGRLLFRRSGKPGRPVAQLREGTSPVAAVAPMFNPQEYYSHLTGLEPITIGLEGAQHTVSNPHLRGVLRPTTFSLPDTLGVETVEATEAKAGRMFANAAQFRVELATWRTPAGRLWAPNDTVKLEAPGAMVYRPYEFVIRAVDFYREGRSESATLTLVLPGAFDGSIPEVLPWD